MRQDARGESDGDALRAEHEEEGELGREDDGLLLAAVVGRNEFGEIVVEELRGGQVGQAALDIARGGGGVAGVDVAEIALAFDEIAAVDQHDQRIADGGVAVRMELHGVAHDVGDLDEAAVVVLVQRIENAALDGLESVLDLGDGAVADDIGGVLQKIAVHEAVQGAVAEVFLVHGRGGRRRSLGTGLAAGLAALGRARGVLGVVEKGWLFDVGHGG